MSRSDPDPVYESGRRGGRPTCIHMDDGANL